MVGQLEISYTIHPPAEVKPADSAPASKKQTFPGSSIETSSTREYYTSISAALREAQVWLNDSLTVWKDAIGDREKSKEDRGKVVRGQGRAAVMSREAKAGIMAGSGIGADAREGDEEEEEDEA